MYFSERQVGIVPFWLFFCPLNPAEFWGSILKTHTTHNVLGRYLRSYESENAVPPTDHTCKYLLYKYVDEKFGVAVWYVTSFWSSISLAKWVSHLSSRSSKVSGSNGAFSSLWLEFSVFLSTWKFSWWSLVFSSLMIVAQNMVLHLRRIGVRDCCWWCVWYYLLIW